MIHASLTPLLGREFDNFLFASIGDEQNGRLLSVISALARLDIDPWKEASSLARMPRELAMDRLTSLIASLPKGPATGLSPEVIAARLIALLPHAAGFKVPAPALALLQVAPTHRSRLFLWLGALALLLVIYFVFTTRASNAPGGIADAPAASSEPAARR
jgi:hypothetical protein